MALPCRGRALGGILTLLVSIGIEAPTAASSADDALHHVKYVLWAESPVHAEIYYRDTDPPTFAAYSHNPYEFSPKVEADVGPDKHWVLDVMLADPNQWAMVVGLVPLANSDHNFHCALAIDGTVVFTNAGPKGALCSLRHW